MNTPLLLTVKEVSELLRINRPKVYDLIKSGSIEGFKLGADWRVKRESIEKIIGKIPEEFFRRSEKIISGDFSAHDDTEKKKRIA